MGSVTATAAAVLRKYRLAWRREWSKAAVLTTTKTTRRAARGQWTTLVATASAGGIACRVQMIGENKARMTVCVEIGTAGQALAPCDLVARNLWQSSASKLQLQETTPPHTELPIMHARSSQFHAGPSYISGAMLGSIFTTTAAACCSAPT